MLYTSGTVRVEIIGWSGIFISVGWLDVDCRLPDLRDGPTQVGLDGTKTWYPIYVSITIVGVWQPYHTVCRYRFTVLSSLITTIKGSSLDVFVRLVCLLTVFFKILETWFFQIFANRYVFPLVECLTPTQGRKLLEGPPFTETPTFGIPTPWKGPLVWTSKLKDQEFRSRHLQE